MSNAAPAPDGDSPLSAEQIAWRWKILISTFFGYAGFYLCRKVFGLVKKPISGEFNWEMDSIAYIWAVFLITYALGQFINGFVGRKWGPRTLLLGGLGISILCGLVFAYTSSYYAFMFFMAINGLVQAGGWPGSVGAVAHWIRPNERGRIMGAWSTSYIFGNLGVKALGSFLLGVSLMSMSNWRVAFLGCTVAAMAVWVLLYFWQRDKPEDVGLPGFVNPDADEEGRAIQIAVTEHVTLKDYLHLASNPVIISMGLGYFFIKFLRYALDSWLPTFLAFQGVEESTAGYLSMGFDIGGIIPSVFIGIMLDRYFRGDWAKLCFLSGIGLVIGYICVLQFEDNPVLVATCFALVGFMLYGPDTLLCGASSVAVAGERNAVAVAGLVNGIGSIGPIVQELVIGKIMKNYDNKLDGIHFTNKLAFIMSIMFAIMMLVTMWRVHKAHQNNAAAAAKR